MKLLRFLDKKYNYDVFLSFRGTNINKTFIDHLYTALNDAGLCIFRDDDGIRRQQSISSKLRNAIINSNISIIVFSENSAPSKAYLEELEAIVGKKRCILPIFYHVEPAEIKKQARRGFAVNLTEEMKRRWSDAIKKVARIEGMHLKTEQESLFIDQIVEMVREGILPYDYRVLLGLGVWDITRRIMDNSIDVDKHVICGTRGLGKTTVAKFVYDQNYFRVPDITRRIMDNSIDVDKHVICGTGGLGKTTVAKSIYDENYFRFDGSCFLENIREVCKNKEGLVRLQNKLLSDIGRKRVKHRVDVEDGVILDQMNIVIGGKSVLLVLDDVDDVGLLNDLSCGGRFRFAPGSRIIITTRREGLLNGVENHEVHRIEKLDYNESYQLFSMSAFGEIYYSGCFREQSKSFVKHCQGLPFVIEVLGSSLYGKETDAWDSALNKLQVIPDEKVEEKLRISYELQTEHDKNMFLDIACFFVGRSKTKVATILGGCDNYYTLSGIQNLVNKSLVTVDRYGKMQMNHLLQDMAKQIVLEESFHPEERSRLWDHKESFNIARMKNGTERIEGLILDMNMLKYDNSETINHRHQSRRFFLGKANNEAVLKTSAFSTMCNLRLLKLSYVELSGSYNEVFPKSLRWLYWRGFSLKSLPRGFPPENIVSLELCDSSLQQIWKETKVLGSLKFLNLSHSHKLVEILDFSRTPNLEQMIVKDCPSLVKIDKSIAKLERLTLLNFEDCTNLRKLPEKLDEIMSLEELNISGCSNLLSPGDVIAKMALLETLRCDRIEFNQLLPSATRIKPWYSLNLQWSRKPRKNSQLSFDSLPSNLENISFARCNLSNEAFPVDFLRFSKLKNLNLRGNKLSSLPGCFKDLASLEKLNLSQCPKLKQIRWPSISLQELDITECTALEQITYETSVRPQEITHGSCMNLNYIQWGFKIESIKNLDTEMLDYIGFFGLNSIMNVEVMIVNQIVWSKKKCPTQVLYESGIFSTYFPGSEVPDEFLNKCTGSSISFTVYSLPRFKIRGLNLCLVYTLSPDILHGWPEALRVKIKNKSKQVETMYRPRCYAVPEANEEMVWLLHVCSGILFEEGDEIQVSFETMVDGCIKKCGAHILCYEEKELLQYNDSDLVSSWDENMRVTRLAESGAYGLDPPKLRSSCLDQKFKRTVPSYK